MAENQEFLQAMAKLNRDFLAFVTKNLNQNPGADLSPSLKSYLQNLSDLDEKYAGDSKENQRPTKRAVLPLNKNLQQLRKRVQVDPTTESMLQSPDTPTVKKQ